MTNAPYYIYPDIQELKTATGERRRQLARRISASVDDPIALRTILGIDPEEFRSFYPDMTPPQLSTDEAIDSFIGRFGKESDNLPDPADDEPIPVAPPAIDYASTFLGEEDGQSVLMDETASAIDSFLGKTDSCKTSAAEPKKTAPAPRKDIPAKDDAGKAPNTDLSESLAKIMIKNRNYAKALEIITDLSLNNPKKSIYFADQIRFLKKLIANSKKD